MIVNAINNNNKYVRFGNGGQVYGYVQGTGASDKKDIVNSDVFTAFGYTLKALFMPSEVNKRANTINDNLENSKLDIKA